MYNRQRMILALLIIPVLLLMAPRDFGVSETAAEDPTADLEVSADVIPEAILEPEDVQLMFHITNVSDIDAQNVVLYSAADGNYENLGEISAGGECDYGCTHAVTESELTAGQIVYHLTSDDPLGSGEGTDYEITVPIERAEPNASLEFTRRAASPCTAKGETAALLYTLRNTGNVPVEDITVFDDAGNYTAKIDRIEAGESRKLINRFTVSDECVSNASVSFSSPSAGVGAQKIQLDDMTIGCVERALSITFSASEDDSMSGIYNAELVLVNGGSADITCLNVYDDIMGGIIAEKITLDAHGGSETVTFPYKTLNDDGYRWRIEALDDTGAVETFYTDAVKVEPNEPEDIADVTISASVSLQKISEPGRVTAVVDIENAGDAQISDVTLSEDSIGKLAEFVLMPPRGSIERKIAIDVAESSKYTFTLQYTDREGLKHSLAAEPVSVEIVKGGALPEDKQPAVQEYRRSGFRLGDNTLYFVLLISGVVVLIILTVILLVATRKAKVREEVQREIRRQNRKKDV